MHNDFTLFFRVVPSGKKVVYYYAYDENGNRSGAWSTGLDNKTAARNYCNRLNREGKLFPQPMETPTFEEFANGFWDWENSVYLKDRKKRRKLTQNYADKNKRVTSGVLVPYFGKMKLDKITGEFIDGWLDYMINEEYKNTTTNGYYGTLMTMIKWAVRKRIIERDPFLDVQRLLDDTKERSIFTQNEFKELFTEDWKKVWNNDFLQCTANKLAALTGLRCSEVLGLRGEYVFDDHIFVCAQHNSKYGYTDTKTKTKDNISLAPEVIKDLRKLMKVNGNGYVFSLTKGDKPVTGKHIYNGLRKALVRIGINEEERLERGLNIHAWRHFCNTELLKGGLSISQVQAVTRHKSERMTERYTHFNPKEFTEVLRVQEDLLKPKTIKNKVTDKPVLKLVKLTEDDNAFKKRKVS